MTPERAFAKAATRVHYFGPDCKRRHGGRRYTSSGHCVLCSKISRRKGEGRPEPTRIALVCECCGKTTSIRKGLAVDHDHVTGKFRGWLCFDCNTGIGKLGDTIVGLERALDYLRRANI